MWQKFISMLPILQSVLTIYYKLWQLLQSETKFITKYDGYLKSLTRSYYKAW